MGVLSFLTDVLSAGVAALGYPGIFAFMFLEGAITPIPSEVVLPFAGFLAAQGTLNLLAVILVASVGTMAGSGVAWYLGFRLGRPFVLRFGRYLLLDESDLVRAETWFARWGPAGVFLANCLPGSRSIVGYPAGAGRMAFFPFLFATFGGAMVWNSVLAFAGWFLLAEWVRFVEAFELIDLVTLVAVLAGIGGWVYYKKRRAPTTAS